LPFKSWLLNKIRSWYRPGSLGIYSIKYSSVFNSWTWHRQDIVELSGWINSAFNSPSPASLRFTT
jgi:hypothetical protein